MTGGDHLQPGACESMGDVVFSPEEAAMREWFYAKDAMQHGPVDEATLRAALQSGEVSPDALVWTDGQQGWLPAREVEPWVAQFAARESAPVDASVTHVRPWIRFFARYIDVVGWSVACGVVLAMLSVQASGRLQELVLGFVMLAAFIPVEALLIARTGSTPGKALLRTRVEAADGSLPTYRAALMRSAQVWLLGMGAGLVTLITCLLGYQRLRRDGAAPWDRGNGLVVRHARIGPLRGTLVAAGVLGFIALLLALAALGESAGG